MFMLRQSLILASLLMPAAAWPAPLLNAGFEQGWAGWEDLDPNKDATSISGHFLSGFKSAKITKETGRFQQSTRVMAASGYDLVAYVKGPGIIGVDIAGRTYQAESAGDGERWVELRVPFTTDTDLDTIVFGLPNGGEGRFDDFQLIATSGPALEKARRDASGPRVYSTLDNGCENLSQLRIKRVSDDGTADPEYPPERAIDHRFEPESRWSSKGSGKTITFDLALPHTLKEVGLAFFKGNERQSIFEVSASINGKDFTPVVDRTESVGRTTAIERYDLDDLVAKYVRVTGYGNTQNAWNSLVEFQAYGCGLGEIEATGDGSATAKVAGLSHFGLKTDQPPAANFDLAGWKITVPIDADHDGRADEILENALMAGWSDRDVFYTDPVSGAMVFRSSPGSAATTQNSSYGRSELRGMLRKGDDSIRTRSDDGTPTKNNWVFATAPLATQRLAGGVNGTLNATLSVDQVTRIGDSAKVGRVVIGQIHAKDDEPIRLYYRKLPFNTHGSIYFAHEKSGGGETWVELIGSRASDLENPPAGVLLGEVFSYQISVTAEERNGVMHPMLNVSITRSDGSVVAAPPLDMSASGYSVANDFMYFKAGAYSQNNTTDWPERDVDQVSFYALKSTHDQPPE